MAIAKTSTIPYNPIGVKALLAWYESNNREPPRGLQAATSWARSDYGVPSNYGEGHAFRSWLYDEYNGAEIVKQNKKTVIRFTDEYQCTMFMLRWS